MRLVNFLLWPVSLQMSSASNPQTATNPPRACVRAPVADALTHIGLRTLREVQSGKVRLHFVSYWVALQWRLLRRPLPRCMTLTYTSTPFPEPIFGVPSPPEADSAFKSQRLTIQPFQSCGVSHCCWSSSFRSRSLSAFTCVLGLCHTGLPYYISGSVQCITYVCHYYAMHDCCVITVLFHLHPSPCVLLLSPTLELSETQVVVPRNCRGTITPISHHHPHIFYVDASVAAHFKPQTAKATHNLIPLHS